MWIKPLLGRLRNDQKGVSSIVGGLIMLSLVFGFTTFVLVQKAKTGQMRARGLMETMKEAEQRQSQLIDFSYADEEGGSLHAYVSNYGWEGATIEKVWVAGSVMDDDDWEAKLPTTDSSTSDKLPKRKFVEIVVSSLPSGRGSEYSFALLTESNSVYKWKVHV